MGRLVLILLSLLVAVPVSAGGPQPVTPAGTSREPFVAGVCPGFHWTDPGPAERIELVVYPVGPADGSAEPEVGESVRYQTLSGAARFWTPSRTACLEKPGRYSWSVRAINGSSDGEWSQPAFFEVSGSLAALAWEGSEAGLWQAESPGAVAAADLYQDVAASVSDPASRVAGLDGEPQATRSASRVSASLADFQVEGSAWITNSLAVGSDEIGAPLHVRSEDIEIPSSYLNGEEVIVEGVDAVLGIYSSEAGSAGSALVLGETVDDSAISNEKWAIVRETSAGGADLRFTYGSSANYFTNDTKLEIGDDGKLSGFGLPVVWGRVSSNGTILAGSGNFTVTQNLNNEWEILSPDLDCGDDPIVLLTVLNNTATRSSQYFCFTGRDEVVVYFFDSVGTNFLEAFSFAMFRG